MSSATPSNDSAGTSRNRVKEVARNTMANATDAARSQARHLFDEQRRRATDEIGRLASALRQAGQNIEGKGFASTLIQRAADTLDNFGGSFDGKDLDSVLGEVGTFARRHPAAFLGIAAAIGFTAARFVKSSATSDDFDTAVSTGSPRGGEL